MIKKFKNQNGAISLFALLSAMFFLAFMVGAYRIVSSHNGQQVISIYDLQKAYAVTDDEAKSKYSSVVAPATEAIPISNYEQFKKIHSGENIEVNGKVYNFSTTASYYLTDDIMVDLDRNFNEINAPQDYLLYSTTKGSNALKLDRAGHDFIYYKSVYESTSSGNLVLKKYLLLAYQDIDKALFNRSTMNPTFSGGALSSINDTHSEWAYTNLNKILGNKIDSGIFFKDTNGYELLLMYPDGKDTKTFNSNYYNIWQQKVSPLSQTYDLNAISKKDITIKMSSGFQGITIPAIDSNINNCLFDGNIRNGTSSHTNWWFSIVNYVKYQTYYIPGPGSNVRMSAFFIRVN